MALPPTGQVIVPATIENLMDLYEVSKGTRRPKDVRRDRQGRSDHLDRLGNRRDRQVES